MVGMKCHTSIFQYMPKKPKMFGVKLWVLYESKSVSASIYITKSQGYNQESGLAYRVVTGLMRVYLDRNHYLFTIITHLRKISWLIKTKYICLWDNSIKPWPIPRWLQKCQTFKGWIHFHRNSPNSVTNFYSQIADKKLTATVFPL